MTTLHQFSVLADFPEGMDATEAETAIANAIDVYCKERGMTHATTLLTTTPGMTVVDLLSSVSNVSKT